MEKALEVTKIQSLHYYEFGRDFSFEGEKHDFWELLYSDKGEMELFLDGRRSVVRSGELLVIAPGVFHAAHIPKAANNTAIISFSAAGVPFAQSRLVQPDETELKILAQIFAEMKRVFLPPYDNLRVHTLTPRKDEPFGGEQLICNLIEQLMILLVRGKICEPRTLSIRVQTEDAGINELIAQMQKEVELPKTLADFCRETWLSQSALKSRFKKATGYPVMQYFRMLKLDRAKTLLAGQEYNVTQVAEKLGFNSVHYFSNVFKQFYHVSPTEYLNSILNR